MVTKKKTVDKNQSDIKPYLTVKESVVASIAGIASGLIATVAEIRHDFFEESRKLPGIADTFKDGGRTTSGKPVNILVKEGLHSETAKKLNALDLDQKIHRRPWPEFNEAKRVIKKKSYDDTYKMLHEEYNLPKGFFSGTIARFESLSPSNTRRVIFAGLSTAAVVGVSIYGLLTSIATRNKTKVIEDLILKKSDELQTSTDAKIDSIQLSNHASEPSTTLPVNKVSNVAKHERLSANEAAVGVSA